LLARIVLSFTVCICSKLIFPIPASAETICVPSDQPNIQAAIDISEDGDTVLVAVGTFSGEGNHNIDFRGKAITVVSENGPENTVIDCEGNRGFIFRSREESSSRLEGFGVCNANVYFQGAGISVVDSSPLISNCNIFDNISRISDGGGLYCSNSSLILSNCRITGNHAYNYGGGIYSVDSSPSIKNCTIAGNSSVVGRSYEMYCERAVSLLITNCIFWSISHQPIQILNSREPLITYSDIRGGWEGEGNIDADPLFKDPGAGDFTLLADSPCVDAGDPYSRLDQDGSISDMGCFGGKGGLPEGVIGGSISGILSKSGSPFIVSENIVIEEGDSLRVEPGVDLLLNNHSSILVQGSLLAEGTSEDPIVISRFREWDIGGGIQFDGGGGSLSYCRIEYCRNFFGGGIYCRSSSPSIEACTITGNSALYDGGGIFCYDSSPQINNCIISRNISEDGGGIYCYSSAAVISECAVFENRADRGAGICIYFNSPEITNCTFTANEASEKGGGVYCYYSSAAINNCIFWQDSPEEIDNDGQNPIVTYTDITGGWPGEGNIDEDPIFIDPESSNFQLFDTSPCIDAGDPETPNVRWGGSRRDMGAFEFDKGWYLSDTGYIVMKPLGSGIITYLDEPPDCVEPGSEVSLTGAVKNNDASERSCDRLLFILESAGTDTLTVSDSLVTLAPGTFVLYPFSYTVPRTALTAAPYAVSRSYSREISCTRPQASRG